MLVEMGNQCNFIKICGNIYHGVVMGSHIQNKFTTSKRLREISKSDLPVGVEQVKTGLDTTSSSKEAWHRLRKASWPYKTNPCPWAQLAPASLVVWNILCNFRRLNFVGRCSGSVCVWGSNCDGDGGKNFLWSFAISSFLLCKRKSPPNNQNQNEQTWKFLHPMSYCLTVPIILSFLSRDWHILLLKYIFVF